jgi:hypothetical protein
MTEMAKEQRFLQMLIEELIGESKTGIIYGDNEAAMYLSKNKHVSARTKHIDIKIHYIRDHVEEGRAVITPVRTDENFSYILTKNVAVSTFVKMSKALLEGFKNLENKFQWVEGANSVTWKGEKKCYTHPKQRVRDDRNCLHQAVKSPEWEFEQGSAHTAKQKENVENKKNMGNVENNILKRDMRSTQQQMNQEAIDCFYQPMRPPIDWHRLGSRLSGSVHVARQRENVENNMLGIENNISGKNNKCKQ